MFQSIGVFSFLMQKLSQAFFSIQKSKPLEFVFWILCTQREVIISTQLEQLKRFKIFKNTIIFSFLSGLRHLIAFSLTKVQHSLQQLWGFQRFLEKNW